MKRLTAIVELMGGQISYELWNGEHIYTVVFGKTTFSSKSTRDNVAQKNIESMLSETFPTHYSNAVNQLK